MENDELLFGSFIRGLPVIEYVQSKFDIDVSQEWLRSHWYYSVIASLIYLILLWRGRNWMSSRSAFDLRRSLFMWNVGLAVFSIFGMLSMLPNLVHAVAKYGMHYTVCHTNSLLDPHQAVWGFIFVLSKVIEFGDTAFIVLRKSPLVFLHWYHHVTVCIYSWYGLGHTRSAVGGWFGAMNYTVHSAMYSYYATKAARIRVPSIVAKIVTLLQISQMFIALYVNIMNYVLSQQLGNAECASNEEVFKVGMIIYGSYAILFLKFFYDRYCSSTKRE